MSTRFTAGALLLSALALPLLATGQDSKPTKPAEKPASKPAAPASSEPHPGLMETVILESKDVDKYRLIQVKPTVSALPGIG